VTVKGHLQRSHYEHWLTTDKYKVVLQVLLFFLMKSFSVALYILVMLTLTCNYCTVFVISLFLYCDQMPVMHVLKYRETDN